MYILRIEHGTEDYEGWKRAFDDDPIGREKSGVRSYRILRPVDDPSRVMIDLEFETSDEAEAMHAALRKLWDRVDMIRDPHARTVEIVESHEY